MSRVLLDTTFLVDIERSASVLDEVIGDDDDVAIAAVTVAELGAGALQGDARRRRSRHEYLDEVISTLPVLDYGLDVAVTHAEMLALVRSQGRPRGAHDLIIAATARTFDRAVVTADRRAFDDLPGVEVRSYR